MAVTKLAADAKASGEMKVESETRVTATFSARVNESSGDRYSITTQFDFEGCSREEILALATRSVVIDAQRQWRVLAGSDLKKATDPKAFALVNVKKDILDASRKTADPVAKARNALEKLGPEERAALLAMLTAK